MKDLINLYALTLCFLCGFVTLAAAQPSMPILVPVLVPASMTACSTASPAHMTVSPVASPVAGDAAQEQAARLKQEAVVLATMVAQEGAGGALAPVADGEMAAAIADELTAAQAGGATPDVDDGRGTPYIVNRSDSICGLDDPKILTNPTKVDYQALLDVTPEVREMKKKKISKSSARGIQLMNDAESRVRDKCEDIRGASVKGYCSVWKKIARRDGKSIPDLTAEVKKAILAK